MNFFHKNYKSFFTFNTYPNGKAKIKVSNNDMYVFLLVLIFGAIFGFVKTTCFSLLGEKIDNNLGNELFSKFLQKVIIY